MFIKKRFLARDTWKRVTKREYTEKPFKTGNLSGTVGILKIHEVSEPFAAEVCGKMTILADAGITWIEILPENENWCLTAMYRQNSMLQFYFDVTLENATGSPAYFFDLFLDVIVDPDGNTKLLDRDELDAALSEGVIDENQYKLSLKTAGKLLSAFPENLEKLDSFCKSFL